MTNLEKRIAAALNAEGHPDMDDVSMLLDVLTSERARAEQAERERDEARNGWLRDAELLKRAEADNARERDAHAMTARGWEKEAATWREERAALVERIRALEEIASEDHRSPVDGNGAGYGRAFAEGWKARGLHIRRIVGALKSQPAPAAPAEYVRALEAVREAIEPFKQRWDSTLASDDLTVEEWDVVLACGESDALKGKS